MFRALFIANGVSSVGGWMQEVGRAWLMTELTPSPLYVALVQASAMIAMVGFSLPAGVLADAYDRRRILIASQGWTLLVTAVLGALTLAGAMTPPLLLLLTFAAAAGTTFTGPAWQAALPDLVPPDDLDAAVTLNGLSFNAARAVGPAVGGVLVAQAGPAAVFLLNAASFAGVLVALLLWRSPRPMPATIKQSGFSALRDGLRYARSAPPFRAVLARTAVFALPASALWALLPLLARGEGDAGTYGLLLALIGVGAVATGIALPAIRRFLPDARLAILAGLTLAASLATAAVPGLPARMLAVMAAGAGWLTVLTLLSVAAQASVPDWVRGRALAIFLLVFASAMTIGSVAWGALAEATGVTTAIRVAAIAQALAALLSMVWSLQTQKDDGAVPAERQWPEPTLAADLSADRGPVLVTVEYDTDPAARAAFLAAMARLGPRARQAYAGRAVHP